MSTQQDIYAAGSENRPPMLNKDNYVPWSSRLLRYAKSKPNGKLIYNSIMNGPYVRRMIPEPGDPDHEAHVAETFHKQTNDEQTEKKKSEVNELRAERLARTHDPLKLMKNSNNPYNYPVFHQDQPSLVTYIKQPQHNNNFNLQPSFNTNQRISSNPRNRQIAQPSMNLGQDRQMQMVRGIANLNANQIGNGNVVAAQAEGNTQLLIAQKEEARIQLQAEEFDFMAAAGDLE
ncbi:hypothetical protein Tco_0894793 [Tanacetum coccineum]|uniref:Uncharacterized protein n=1 Tax=Tanacetum coccineum TaxID=301880 RepID=A0ABQ5CG13_9ASTR